MLRALTETVLLMAEFALDEVTDIQIAVDEIATDLIDAATDGSVIDCEFTYGDGRIEVCLTATATTREVVDETGLGWHVIRTITESATAEVGSYDRLAGGFPMTVAFSRDGTG